MKDISLSPPIKCQRFSLAITGEVTAIKRVIEVDIHLAVNEKGRKGAYSTESAEQLKTLMTTKYNEKGYLDDEGLPVEFKLNFNEFDPKTVSFPESSPIKNRILRAT